jgi:hypothetical protein
MQDTTGIAPTALPVAKIDADAILAFLNHVERNRRCSVRSRNVRLAALRGFFRFVSLHDPSCLGMATRIMAIPNKRFEKKLVGFLSRAEVKALVAAPDCSTWSGRRDHALLLTLYDAVSCISMPATQISSCWERAGRSASSRSGTKQLAFCVDGFARSTTRRMQSSFQALGASYCHAMEPTTFYAELSSKRRRPVQV